MSFLFSGGGGSAANPSAQSEVVQSATTEIEMITDLFVGGERTDKTQLTQE